MNFQEKEGYYYEFKVDVDFVPQTIIDNFNRRTWVVNHVNNQLGQFISENIVKDGLHFSPDRIFLIAKNDKERTKVKKFCHFIMENDTLLNMAIEDIITRFKLDNFQDNLNKVYDTFNLKESLTDELVDHSSNAKKKPKV